MVYKKILTNVTVLCYHVVNQLMKFNRDEGENEKTEITTLF